MEYLKQNFFNIEPSLFDGSEEEIHQYAKKLLTWNQLNIKYDTWCHYNNKTLHTAVPCENTGTRILIRLKEVLL